MKFSPCISQCTLEGSHCMGCGRSREEIRATLDLVKQVSEHLLTMGYDNPDEFVDMLAAKALKRHQRELAKQQPAAGGR